MSCNTPRFSLSKRKLHVRLGWKLVTAVRTTVRVFEPLLDTLISKDVLAFGEADWLFDNTVRVLNAEFIIADHASYLNISKFILT
jgi:hypothetical protein